MDNNGNEITYFGFTDARNKRVRFGIKAKDRVRHVYTVGKTGMGKSTLLENMAIQDIRNGNGFAFIDPHGKTADLLLDYIPENRMKDVLYFAPFDMENPISFNVMEDVGPDKRHLVVSGLMSAFKKIWVDAWSARMEYILQNTLLALLEYPGATLLAINKMLSDKEFRKQVLEHVTDPTVRSFWVDEFAKYTDRFAAEATPAIQNKVGQFTSNPLIRNIVGQPNSSFDIRKMMDEKKILIINLSKGRVGEGNANLLGSMLITKIYLAAMSRADVSEKILARLPQFYLYVDEFQSFANESFADILSEARKYKLNLTMAHQYLEQMSEEVRAAVFGNVGTMVIFRVGPFDAEVFEKEFVPTFTAEDFVNLGMYQMYLKLMIDGVTSHPFSATGMPPIQMDGPSFKDGVIESSRRQFARPRREVEDNIITQIESTPAPEKTVLKRKEERQDRKDRQEFENKPRREEVKESGAPKKKVEDGAHLSDLRMALSSVLGPPEVVEDKEVLRTGDTNFTTPQVVKEEVKIEDNRVVNNISHNTNIKIENKNRGKRDRNGRREERRGDNRRSERPDDRQENKRLDRSIDLETENTDTANKLALKAALEELLKKETKPKEQPKEEVKSETVFKETKNINVDFSDKVAPKEIPEKDLKAMLEVSEDETDIKK